MAISRTIVEAPALYRQAAAAFARVAAEAVAKRGRFIVALSGGNTPQGLYAAIVADAKLRESLPWDRTLVFWGDERQVPPDHPDSNYGMAREALLSKVPVSEVNVHRIQGELSDASEAAHRYEDDMRSALGLAATDLPCFDLVLLGLGADGHTASLFPGTEALQERHRAATANWIDTLRAWRITLTLPAINRARSVLFLVCGEDKAEAVKSVLEGRSAREPLPARLVRPRPGKLVWFMDPAAARLLDGVRKRGARSPRRRR